MPRINELTGQRLGLWEVLEQAATPSGKQGRFWFCRCDCGTQRVVSGGNLTRTRRPSRSCGCELPNRELQPGFRHGQHLTQAYRAYHGMLQRCFNTKTTGYAYYGGRGIGVTERWLGPDGFNHFLEDLGHPPSPQHSIDRIDNDGDYEPRNCRWATKTEQANNRRTLRKITYLGRTQTIAAWCREFSLNYPTVQKRFRLGWSIERVFQTRPMSPQESGRLSVTKQWGTAAPSSSQRIES